MTVIIFTKSSKVMFLLNRARVPYELSPSVRVRAFRDEERIWTLRMNVKSNIKWERVRESGKDDEIILYLIH